MRCIIIILMLASTAAMAAGWDTNCWPLWEHVREYGLAESNVVAQINARGALCGGSASVSFWRTRSGNLATIKTALYSMVPGWGGDEWGYRWVRSDVATNPVVWLRNINELPAYTNIIQVLIDCRLPTNYLAYTPWRDISGAGGYTNDIAAVGHPHGVTNAYTAAGGTNWPAGRTCWYTTDYGLDGLKVILEKLNVINPYHGLYTRWGGSEMYEGWGSGDNLAAAQADAITNYAYAGDGYPYSFAAQYNDDPFGATAYLRSGKALMAFGAVQPAITSYTCSVRAFFEVGAAPLPIGFGIATNEFDDVGTGYIEGWNEVAGASITNAGSHDIVAWVGTTNAASVWPTPIVGTWISRGWSQAGDYCAMVTIDF